jgi:hypothetical protein
VEGREEYVQNVLTQLVVQKLPNPKVLSSFGTFPSDLRQMIERGMAAGSDLSGMTTAIGGEIKGVGEKVKDSEREAEGLEREAKESGREAEGLEREAKESGREAEGPEGEAKEAEMEVEGTEEKVPKTKKWHKEPRKRKKKICRKKKRKLSLRFGRRPVKVKPVKKSAKSLPDAAHVPAELIEEQGTISPDLKPPTISKKADADVLVSSDQDGLKSDVVTGSPGERLTPAPLPTETEKGKEKEKGALTTAPAAEGTVGSAAVSASGRQTPDPGLKMIARFFPGEMITKQHSYHRDLFAYYLPERKLAFIEAGRKLKPTTDMFCRKEGITVVSLKPQDLTDSRELRKTLRQTGVRLS